MTTNKVFLTVMLFLGSFGICRQPASAEEQNVISLWNFDGSPEKGVYPGTGHPAKLRGGAESCDTGRLGACIRSFRGKPTIKTPGGAVVPNSPELTPNKAFTLDLSIRPDEAFFSTTVAFLLDKTYLHYGSSDPRFNHDYQLYLSPTSGGKWTVTANLGFGKDSVAYRSRPITLEAAKWCQIAFTYDGAGTGRLYCDGLMIGDTHHKNRHGISAGSYPLVIGDRIGRDCYPFPGCIDQLRITNRQEVFRSEKILLDVDRPLAFRRMSKRAYLTVTLKNDLFGSFRGGTLNVSVEGKTVQSIAIDPMSEDGKRIFRIPVDTALAPGRYAHQLAVCDAGENDQIVANRKVDVFIVARPTPLKMPVVMWGHGNLEQIQKAGFTHSFVTLVNCKKVWSQGRIAQADNPTQYDQRAKTLDQALIDGFGVVGYIGAAGLLNATQPQFLRIDRLGQKRDKHKNICGLFPEVQTFCYNIGASIARTYGKFPAFEAAMVETETRDGTSLCFHRHDCEAFRTFAGYDIPKEANSKLGVAYSTLESFPPDRIIPDNHPILTYLKWFWQRGDGWNSIYTQIHRGLESTGLKDLWTWFDPAVRAAGTSGSGGEVDFISQWTYSYPDPIKIGKATDELFAMAELSDNPDQGVMKMTQAIWYRSATAPKRKEGEETNIPLTEWEKSKADANYITIAPDHLRETFWSKLSRPIGGIMYHGWWSLMDVGQNNRYGYRYTNSKSQHVLKELVDTVITPLGPTLLQVPDRRSDVAFLQSFTSEMFAGVAEFGWGWGWENDAYQILRYAHLQPRVVFDETILRQGLKDFRMLVLVKCPVLTRKVADAIVGFQERGGIIIGDENLAPGISPDVILSTCKRTKRPAKDKAMLQTKASELRRELASAYKPYAESDNPDVLVRLRRHETTDYLFALNDKRTFGDYVGQFGLVMEKGLPAKAKIIIDRQKGHVYDLVNHTPIDSSSEDGQIEFNMEVGPGSGYIYMITETYISNVAITTQQQVKRGQTQKAKITVTDKQGNPVEAVVPLRVTILDPEGKTAEFGGYYGAKNGQLTLTLDMATNDLLGQWIVEVEELASGTQAQETFEVMP